MLPSPFESAGRVLTLLGFYGRMPPEPSKNEEFPWQRHESSAGARERHWAWDSPLGCRKTSFPARDPLSSDRYSCSADFAANGSTYGDNVPCSNAQRRNVTRAQPISTSTLPLARNSEESPISSIHAFDDSKPSTTLSAFPLPRRKRTTQPVRRYSVASSSPRYFSDETGAVGLKLS